MRIGRTAFWTFLAVMAVVWGATITSEGQAPAAARAAQAAAPQPAAPARQTPAAPRPAAATAGRADDGKPNLNGIWQTINTANWDVEAHHAEAGPHNDIMGAW